jgi:hypothetical protein
MTVQGLDTLSDTCPRTIAAIAPAGTADIAMSAVHSIKHDGWYVAILCQTLSCRNLFSSCGSESDGSLSNLFVCLFKGVRRTKEIAFTAMWVWHINTSSLFCELLIAKSRFTVCLF